MRRLFTERHGQARSRVAEALDDTTRNGLLTLVSARIDEEWFGLSFPEKCSDGYAYAGTDLTRRRGTMQGYGVLWPREIDRENPPGNEAAGDKEASVNALLDKVSSEPVFRAKLEQEARELTGIGNTFMIRHTEMGKIPVVESRQIDYFFHRMFAMIRLLLRGSGRGM